MSMRSPGKQTGGAKFPRELPPIDGTLLLSTHLDRRDEPLVGPVRLRADEGILVDISR